MDGHHIELQEDQYHPDNQQVNEPNVNPVQQMAPQQLAPELYEKARSNFVFKVYSIVGMQLLITTIFVIITMANPKYADFQVKYSVLTILSSFVTLGAMLTLMCKKQLSEKFPANMIILGVFTLAQSYTVSSICARYDQDSVILAAGVTAASTIGITLYVRFTGSDLSSCRQIVAGVGASLIMAMMFVSVAIFFIQIKLISSLISVGLAILYPLYLILDTQMIMDNIKHKISLDQYVLASIFLYVDIIGIFLDILRLVGNRRT